MSRRWKLRLWGCALLAALVASVGLDPQRLKEDGDLGPETSIEHWQLLGDQKLGRIAARFAGETPERPQLIEWNCDGIRLDLVLDPDQLASMRWRFNRKFYKEQYVDAELHFGDGPPLTARVALRGAGSLDEYHELSFKVKLAQPELFAPGVELRRLYLMALVEDPHKVTARFAAGLMAELDLFPLHHQFVDLYLNGERQGLGMLVEPAVRGIRRTNPTTTAIYRRDSKPKIYLQNWSDGSADAEESMWALRALNNRERLQDPVAAYDQVIDLQAYLKNLAAASILLNQDTYNELWLYQTRDSEGQPRPLRICAWDLEDVVFVSEKRMKGGTPDPLMFWAEGILDHQIANHPQLYARYRDTLARLLAEELSLENIRTAMFATQATVDELDSTLR